MALYQRGRIWWASFSTGDGRRLQESMGTANRREAEKRMALRLAEVQTGRFVENVNVTFAELWKRYAQFAEPRKRSFKRDEQMYGVLKRFLPEHMRLRDLTALRVERFQEARVREVSPSTCNRETALLKHMTILAERWGMLSASPLRGFKLLREDNHRFRVLSPDDERKLIAAAPPYLRDMIVLAVNSGLRCGDLMALRWDEVDADRRLLRLEVRKNRKMLEVPLNAAAFTAVMRQPRYGPYVFANPMTGERWKDVKSSFTSAAAKAGVPGLTWHVLRHTFGSRLSNAGVDLASIKELMGHSQISLTLRYAHPSADGKRRAVEVLQSYDSATVDEKSVRRA